MADPIVASAAPAASEAPASSSESNNTTNQELNSAVESVESDASGKPAVAPTKAEVKAEIKRINKLKLKIDGKETEEILPFDFEDKPEITEYLQRQAQKSKAFDKRSQEYSQLTKEVGSFLEQLRKDPRKVLADPNIGVDVKKLAASIIEEEIENSKKSPQQLEKEKLEAKLRDLEDERKREREEFQQREFERLQAQEYERYDIQISKALESSNLPKSPYVIKKIADYMLMGLNEGLDVSPQDVLPLVQEELQNDLKEMFKLMPDETIEQVVGKDVFSRVRKKNIAKAKDAPPVPVNKSVKDAGGGKGEPAPSAKKQTFKSFFGV